MGEPDARLLDRSALRDAATTIVIRDADTRPRVLMGQRGAGAAFMPSKFVFPGGAVDAADETVPLSRALPDPVRNALATRSDRAPEALFAAAVRELWEETGLLLGNAGDWADPPKGWRSFAATGNLPDGAHATYVFRAITPAGRPRRFDARFFLVDAGDLSSDPDDFSRAEDELSHLQWVPLDEARSFDMPFVTEVVLAEIEARMDGRGVPGVPFFDNSTEVSRFLRL
ncbi:NUDIX domain-containing protein [Rhodobacterales bacterium HKCCE2091]|nr:NUDIX domain-containing protein [Rhodobacterales bacterium HKCCE2091]